MAYTGSWDETIPAGTEVRSLGDDRIRELKRDVRERLASEHALITGSAGLATLTHNAGKCSVAYYGTTVEIAALVSPPQYSLAYDTTLGQWKYYSGAAWVVGGPKASHTHQSTAEGGLIGGVFKFLATPINLVDAAATYDWTDADITAHIGANVAKAALLTATLSIGTNQNVYLRCQVRKNGSAATTDLPGIGGANVYAVGVFTSVSYNLGFFITELDTAYVFESKFEVVSGAVTSAITLRLNLVGYII